MRTVNELTAYYKSHYIHIEREPDGRFYINVDAPSGAACYDGWYPSGQNAYYYKTEKPTMREALIEALKGSLLISTNN